MINTELKIHQFVDSAWVDYNVDLYDTEPIQVERSIIDVNDLAIRVSDHTKTIKLPGTQNNNRVFNSIFGANWSMPNTDLTVNFSPSFNPTLKADATLYINGMVSITGYLQLLTINNKDDYNIEYEIILTGTVASLFQDLGESKISDLPISGDHEYNKANIVASWTNPIGTGYVYPLIDYGLVSDEKNYFVDNLYLAIYLKAIVDAIFTYTGYRYDSAFFDSDRFKRLIVPFSGKDFRISETAVTNRKFEADRASDSSYAAAPNYNNNNANLVTLPFNNTVTQSDPPGYDNSSFKFTVQVGNSGKYIFRADVLFTFKNNHGSLNAAFWDFVSDIRKNGQSIGGKLISNGAILGPSDTINVDYYLETTEQYFNEGDEIYVDFRVRNNNADLQYKIREDSRFFCTPSAQITEGDSIVLSSTLPSDITQASLMTSLFKMFNLYVEADTLDPKKLIIEPRDTFLTTTTVDLTRYVDSEVSIEPMGALQFKNYKYTYQPDQDLKNKLHQDKFIDPYGVRRFGIVNDFVKEEYTTDIIFAPTPLSDRIGVNSRVMSRIWFSDPNQQKSESATAVIRLLYYGGLILPPQPRQLWYIKDRSGDIDVFTAFPYAGHLDDPYDPSFDLSFGAPVQVQYKASLYTDNNLFNAYHKKGVLEITDPDSRIVTFQMDLPDSIRNQMSFRNLYYIGSQYYRLYSMSYDATTEGLTVVKMLRMKTGVSFSPTQNPINGGGTGTGQQGEGDPVYIEDSFRNSNTFDKGTDQVVLGEENNIQTDKVLINSKENTINNEYASIVGGRANNVYNTGTSLINCEGYLTTLDNEAAVNNIQQPFYVASAFTAYDVSGMNGTPLLMIPAYLGYWIEVVDAYATIYFDGASPVAYEASALRLIYETAGTILNVMDDGISSQVIGAKVRGVMQTKLMLDEPVMLTSAGALDDNGTGILRIEVFYRLHKFYQ